MTEWNTRLGVALFGVYCVFYGGFVWLNGFWPEVMESTPWAGINWAILYGFALILAAFVLAVVYGLLCRDAVSPTDHAPATPKGQP